MSLLGVEAATTARRLVRRRAVRVVAGLDFLLLLYTALADRPDSARAALSAAAALAALTVLVLAAGLVADDRAAGRLALAGTHPSPRAVWVVGRWLAVFMAAAAVFTVAGAVLIARGSEPCDPVRLAAGWGTGLAFTAALAALAIALSCRVGSTPQVLLLVAVLVLGAMPPEVVLHPLGGPWSTAARALWALLPTPWALRRLHAWELATGSPAPFVALSFPAQALLWLWVAGRALQRAELGARSG